ncbi:hypothetical protein ACFQ7I_16820 [Streptomyces massasporeus]
MAHASGKYADFDGLREKAVALRRAGLSRRQIRDRLHVDNNEILNRLLQGEPAPDWTKRPNAKDDLRERARELRLQGWTYDQIQVELGCSKSSVGTLSPRELFLVDVGLYWAEGGKDKPYDRRENVCFVNSDPGMIEVFLAWLDLLGVKRERLRFTVMIHESADVAGAERYWADLVGADRSAFNKTTLKRHNPKTHRKNVGDSYRGCLVVKVLKGADLYRRIEGSWYGIVESAHSSIF